MEYVLGIDSGGTKFLVRAADRNGHPLGSFEGAPASINRMSREVMKERVSENIRTLLSKCSLQLKDCRIIVCASTGVDSPLSKEQTCSVYREMEGVNCPVVCINDAEAALYASSGETGVIVISGTGSIAFGRDRNGTEWRCGGWPLCIFGDEGSGTWLNRKALEYMSHVIDGRIEKTPLYSLLDEELNKSMQTEEKDPVEKLISVCKRIEREGSGFLHLGPLIMKAAQEEDYAKELIRTEAKHTFDLVRGVLEHLSFRGDDIRIGAWGSAIVKNPLHFVMFEEMIKERWPKAEVKIPQEDAAKGACRLGNDILDGRTEMK